MTTRHGAGVIEDSVEPLLEELLAEVVTGMRAEPKVHEGERITSALTEAAMATFSRTVSHASAVERALIVEALAPALADALAPALAKTLAPEIVTALSNLAAADEPLEDEYGPDYETAESADDESGVYEDESESQDRGRSAVKGKRDRE